MSNKKLSRLSKRDILSLNNEMLDSSTPLNLTKKDIIEIIVDKNAGELLKINGSISFFKYENKWVPTLKYILQNDQNGNNSTLLKSITVDKGAVKFVVNGADIMRPGILKIDDGFLSGDSIAIKEETYHKIIAIGEALLNSEEMKKAKNGKVVKNLHYMGDKIWEFSTPK